MNSADAWVSERVREISVSAIKQTAMRSAMVPGAASLTWGVPSFQTPAHIRQAVAKQLESDKDIGKYSLPDGLPELRETIARRHGEELGVSVDPAANVVVTAGNMQGLNALLNTIINPGDEIIVTDPGFASHFQQIRLFGGVPVFWQMQEERGWALDIDALPELVTHRTKAIILVSPSNPTGKIFSEAELRRIGEVALERDLLILIDDPYSHFTYENSGAYFNLGSVSELSQNIAYLFTFSKAYAMSGWRAGYVVLPERLKAQMLKVHDATLICPPRISQVAALAGLTQPPKHLIEFETILAKRRELICTRLDALPHVFDYVKPEGAYYVFPRIIPAHESSTGFANDLLENAKVTVTPGSAFGPSGENHVRLAFCVDEDTINLAFDRISTFFPI